MPNTFAAISAVLGLLTVLAAFYDWRWRRIPNWICLSGLAAAVCIHSLNLDWRSPIYGLGLALLIHLPLYLLRASGGGDLKLMAALGALLGPTFWLELFVLSSLLGGLLALSILVARGRVGKSILRLLRALADLLKGRAPFATNPELDIAHPQALTFPRGVVIAAASGLWIILRTR